MQNITKVAVAAMVSLLVGHSTASDAKKLHLFATSAPRPQPVHYRWSEGAAPKAHSDLVTHFERVGLRPGQYVWASSIPTHGDTRVVLDLVSQMGYVYRGDALIGATTISTARHGMITPLGEWSILEKRPFYRSKKYDNAPMPWMQRIDRYGIALHGGGTPGFPESHGCIHLPLKFAQKLYGLTSIGSKVVIEG